MKTRTILVIGAVLTLTVAAYVWFFVYNKAHVDYSEAKALFNGTAAVLYAEATANNQTFVSTYQNNAVIVAGAISEKGENYFFIEGHIKCTTDSTVDLSNLAVDKLITTKGRVVGVDEDILTGELIISMDKCTLLDE
jgi:hypothetical protein